MSIADSFTALQTELNQQLVPELMTQLQTALQEGAPVHVVETQLWTWLLQTGNRVFAAFLDSHGTGDQGETLTLPDGQELRRLPKIHSRPYVSIFGKFLLQRTVYGTREGQTIGFTPLDNRLQLPDSDFSYLLQDWDQSLAMEQAFSQVDKTMARILHLDQHVDSLESMNRQMAQNVSVFRELQPTPPPAEEGTIVVATADGKGIVIRGQGTPTVCGGHRPGNKRANQKRMATVGAVYTVDPHVRTPKEVVAALFRDPDQQPSQRPKPCHKRVWASLPQTVPEPQSSIDVVFGWLQTEVMDRNPRQQRPTVYVHDGQEALWQARAEYLPDENSVEVLDLLHVTPRLWEAGKLLHGERSKKMEAFVRKTVLQVLSGKVETVIRGFRRLMRERRLNRAKKRKMQTIGRYLSKNRERMKYDEYLRKGYPIASGVIEGACRHLIKDRMERAGMHWTVEGAQAMLNVRSVWLNGQWQEYQTYRIDCETRRLYPHKELVAGEAFFALGV